MFSSRKQGPPVSLHHLAHPRAAGQQQLKWVLTKPMSSLLGKGQVTVDRDHRLSPALYSAAGPGSAWGSSWGWWHRARTLLPVLPLRPLSRPHHCHLSTVTRAVPLKCAGGHMLFLANVLFGTVSSQQQFLELLVCSKAYAIV